MDINFTLDDLAQFAQEEQAMFNDLKAAYEAPAPEVVAPKTETISALLNYSKTLSIRDSKLIEKIELTLN